MAEKSYKQADRTRYDLRAYILVEDAKGHPPPQFNQGQKVQWNIQYSNYGKTPSVDEATEAHVWLGKSSFSNVDDFFSKLATSKPPNMASFITPPISEGGAKWVTLASDATATNDDINLIKTTDGGAIMAGRVWYSDVFGDPHWTDFCRYHLTSGANSDCPRHNEDRTVAPRWCAFFFIAT